MVISRAIIRDLYGRERVGAMISLVIAVMMIAQMLSPLVGGLLETSFGWRSIFYATTAASLLIAVGIAVLLPETRRLRDCTARVGFLGDVGGLFGGRAFVGYVLCQVRRRSSSPSPAVDRMSWSRRWGVPVSNTARGLRHPVSPF